MKKYTKFLFLATCSFLVINNNSFSNAYAKEATKTEKNVVIKNFIIDAKTGKALKDAYIKQVGTLNTTISDDKGNFDLEIINEGEKKVVISKEGYETITLEVNSLNSNTKISLYPAISFKNDDLPKAHSDSADLFNYSSKPISSNFTALYQMEGKLGKLPSFNGGGIFTRGFALNELVLNAQIRFDEYAGQVKLHRGRFPVDLDNFEYKPVYNLDNLNLQIAGGKVISSTEKTELYAGLTYMFHFITPDSRSNGDNKPIPFTNSYQDFPQTRQGPGVTGIWGYKFNNDAFFTANGSLYPFIITTFDGLSKNDIGYHGMLELGANLKQELIAGIYVTGGISNQLYFGFNNLLDNSTFINFGLSLDPFKMASLTNGSFK
ncbi:MAG: carboxypeptidase-like regulatory domain-containing protein [Candidatus Sericytochromatia bacterium]